ncbi:MAG: isochorismatase family protein [Candidatus Pelagadaptatus aseana]|uniref:isochorismatase family protein n=1 Tax=Candidatus Pelagadaptatus aseana TaxID=3120508 RepID=UPI0039B17039
MLKIDNTALVIVDVQGKLAQMMSDKETLFANLERMVKGARILGLPIVWAEQNPTKLGATITEVSQHLADIKPVSKMSFSCAGCEDFNQALQDTQCNQVLVVGIEAHICVYQTATGLVDAGYDVEVVTDAVSSRFAHNKDVGLKKMKSRGVALTSTEMALFELMETAEHPDFRAIQQVVK